MCCVGIYTTWSHDRDLNPRPLPYHGSALPTELSRRTNKPIVADVTPLGKHLLDIDYLLASSASAIIPQEIRGLLINIRIKVYGKKEY